MPISNGLALRYRVINGSPQIRHFSFGQFKGYCYVWCWVL